MHTTDTLLLELRSYQQESQQHQHDYHQLVLPARGRLELEVDGRGGHVEAGQLAVIAAGSDHGFAAPGDNAFVVANVPTALAQYANVRWRRNAWVQQRSRRNGVIFHASGALRLARNLAMQIGRERLLELPRLYGARPELR